MHEIAIRLALRTKRLDPITMLHAE